MLQFIFGRAASGKTTYIKNLIKETEENVILLVPEQYTFESEKQMLQAFGSGFMSKVNVLSFSRMCETAGQIYGGISGVRIDDSQRTVLMGRAVKSIAPKLTVFKNYVKNAEFINQVNDIVSEFKLAGISDVRVMSAVEDIKNTALKSKMFEIAQIYSAYNALTEKIYIDPYDDVDLLIKRAAETDFLKGKTIYIDAFKGFTGAQIKLLKLMILKCKKVVISLCDDGSTNDMGGVGTFSNIKKITAGLLKYAESEGVDVAPDIYLKENYLKHDDLKYLEKVVGDNISSEYRNSENITIGKFKSPTEEIEYVFKKIHRMVRLEGYRYRDFVVISRNIESYERIIEGASNKFSVPIFMDKRRSLSFSPLARVVMSALNAAKKLDSESILVLLKSGLLGIDDFEINKLEEYVFVWNINRDTWCSEWTMNPDGIVGGDYKPSPEELSEKLCEINNLRKRVIVPILALRGSFGKNAEEISKALYNFLMTFNVDRQVKKHCDYLSQIGEIEDADFVSDSWDALMQVLDNIVRCYGDESITVEEYISTLELAISGMSLGNIPRTLDEVVLGNADRIRTSRPKVAFVIGLNQGVFPATVSESGLLLKADRIRLGEVGLEISDRFNSFAVDENFMVYSALCAADEKVNISCCEHSLNGAAIEESLIFTKLKKVFKNSIIDTKNISMPETAAEGFSMLAAKKVKNKTAEKSLIKYYENNPEYSARLKALSGMKNGAEHRLSTDTCNKLFGNNIYLSASRIENYNGCSFSYFCRYVLNISPPKKAELDSMQRGTIVHFIMENVLKTLGSNIKNSTENEIKVLVNKYMDEYLKDIECSEYLKNPRFEFLYKNIAKMCLAVLVHISDEFKVCKFEPVSFELDISKKGKLPLLKVEFKNGREVNIDGKVDRVDALKGVQGENYIRIVDYKTNSKAFYLPDVLYGLNMQMLIYLYAIKKLGADLYGKVTPAGILYKPSKRRLQKDNAEDKTGLAMNGMVVNNEEVLNGMDNTNSGKYAPQNTGRDRKSDPIISAEDFETVLSYVEKQISKTAKNITDGIFDVNPIMSEGYSACKYCEFGSVCGKDDKAQIPTVEKLPNAEVINKMREELGDV